MNQLFLNTAQLLLKGTDRNLDSGTVSSVVITGVVVVFIGLLPPKLLEILDKSHRTVLYLISSLNASVVQW